MTHTNEFLSACFSAYMGCKVGVEQEGFKHPQKLIAVDAYVGTIQLRDEAIKLTYYANVEVSKLQLKPLSEISDNADLCVVIRRHLEIEEMFTNFMSDRVRYGHNALNTKDVLFVQFTIPLIDELRRLGYDCGFRDIPSLIDVGIAIKA